MGDDSSDYNVCITGITGDVGISCGKGVLVCSSLYSDSGAGGISN